MTDLTGATLDDADDIRELFGRALEAEPPFATPAVAALDAAVHAGRRRRARSLVGRGLAVAAVAVVAVGTVALLRTPIADGPAALGAAAGGGDGSVAKPAPAASYAPGRSGDEALQVRLDALARSLAAASGGTATFTTGDDTTQGLSALAHVTTAAGAYDLSLSVLPQPYGSTEAWRGTCSPSPMDSKPCVVVASSPTDFMSSVSFTDGSGRSGFLFVASMPAGRTLDVNYTNYTEQGIAKRVGPSWTAAGIGYATVRSAARTAHLTG